MAPHRYQTVADELLEYAEVIATHFQNLGFKVYRERAQVGFPYTPTHLCKRGKITTMVIELGSEIKLKRMEDWVRFGKSSGTEMRVGLCLPSTVNVTPDALESLRERGIGLYAAYSNRLVERIAPADLGLNLALPELGDFSAGIRELLGPAYEQFGRAQWRDGFEGACQALEDEARRYLKRWSHTGRIKILRKKGAVTLSDREINRLTMGGLAAAFAAIQAQNHADSVIAHALTRINKDRIGVVHFRARTATERRLRVNVGQHMWVILAALKEML
jgi:hypothetical protein